MFPTKEETKPNIKTFVTSDGISMDFDVKPLDKELFEEFKESYDRFFMQGYYPPLSFRFFLNKLLIFTFFNSLIKRLFGDIRFKKALDMGAGNCCFHSFLKAKALVDRAISLDSIDRREKDQPNLMKVYMYEVNSEHNRERLVQIKGQSNDIGEVHELIQEFPDKFEIDEFIKTDYLSFTGSDYDLVTSFSSLDYIKCGDFFRKTREIMDKGIVFVIVSNWNSYKFASTGLIMDKPFMQVYLTVDDLKRYYKEIRPELYPYLDKCLYIVNEHFTIEDYRDIAERHGFDMVYYSKPVEKNWYLSIMADQNEAKHIRETVLPFGRKINPNLDIEDLFASFYIMVFKCT